MDAADNAAQLTKHRLIPSHGPRTTSTSSRRSRRPTNGGSCRQRSGAHVHIRAHEMRARAIAARPDTEESMTTTKARHPRIPLARAGPTLRPLTSPSQWLLASLLVSVGAIHVAMAPSHFGESPVEGVGFLVAAWLQIGLGVAVVLRPSRAVVSAVIAVSAASIATWAVSRTAGLPFGEHSGHAESVTIVDGVTVAMEATSILIAVALLSRAMQRFAPPAWRWPRPSGCSHSPRRYRLARRPRPRRGRARRPR